MTLYADVEELCVRVPRRGVHGHCGLERFFNVFGKFVVVVEVVYHLLDAHRVFLGQAARHQRPAHERVSGGVHVYRERGDGLLRGELHGVGREFFETVPAHVFLVFHRLPLRRLNYLPCHDIGCLFFGKFSLFMKYLPPLEIVWHIFLRSVGTYHGLELVNWITLVAGGGGTNV